MTDRKMLEELAVMAMKSGRFVPGQHVMITPNVQLYVNHGDEHKDLKTAFFSIQAFGFEVTHHSYTMGWCSTVDNEIKNFRQFKWHDWCKKVERELQGAEKTIYVNGKMYRLIEEEGAKTV